MYDQRRQAAVPFTVDRLSQYLSPLYIGLSVLLTRPRGPAAVQVAPMSYTRPVQPHAISSPLSMCRSPGSPHVLY